LVHVAQVLEMQGMTREDLFCHDPPDGVRCFVLVWLALQFAYAIALH
jgi:hypothetical protein